jgi:hypothetical protein
LLASALAETASYERSGQLRVAGTRPGSSKIADGTVRSQDVAGCGENQNCQHREKPGATTAAPTDAFAFTDS